MRVSAHYFVGLGLLLSMLVLTRQYSTDEVVPARQPFAAFPLTIEGWTGRDLGLPQDIRDVLKADDLLMRAYENQHEDVVSLFIAYYRSQRTGTTYHSPLNCLPGSGWSIMSKDVVSVDREGGQAAINRVTIQKGLDRQEVLYWYQDRGRFITSEYWAKGYLIWDAMTRNRTDGALVRVSVPVTTSSEQARTAGLNFVRTVLPALNGFLPR